MAHRPSGRERPIVLFGDWLIVPVKATRQPSWLGDKRVPAGYAVIAVVLSAQINRFINSDTRFRQRRSLDELQSAMLMPGTTRQFANQRHCRQRTLIINTEKYVKPDQ